MPGPAVAALAKQAVHLLINHEGLHPHVARIMQVQQVGNLIMVNFPSWPPESTLFPREFSLFQFVKLISTIAGFICLTHLGAARIPRALPPGGT